MNLFKKALVATAIVASFGANATATVSSTPLKLSAEGIAAGNTSTATLLTFDVVVGTLHPAASTITLTFDKTIDLNGLLGGAAVNDPAEGTGRATDVSFDYGTGSFTFDNVVIDDNDQSKGEKDTISFDINLGNPLTADSAFRIYLGDSSAALPVGGGGTDKVLIAGAADVDYASETSGGAAIETGTGVVATETTQFAVIVKTPLDEIITRTDLTDFTTTVATTDYTDSLVYSVVNDETLVANLTAPTFDLVISGDFTGIIADGFGGVADEVVVTTDGATPIAAVDQVTINGAEDELTLALINTDVKATAAAATVELDFDNNNTNIPVTGAVTTTVKVNSVDLVNPITIATALDSGEWALDATIINVPYFPVGYEGTSTSVHFANERATAADVIVSAIDKDGNTYGPLDMGSDLAGDTVTKVSQGAIMSLFGLTEATKLSVTFNIDANDGDVNAYAFTSSTVGRTEISNSQLKGK